MKILLRCLLLYLTLFLFLSNMAYAEDLHFISLDDHMTYQQFIDRFNSYSNNKYMNINYIKKIPQNAEDAKIGESTFFCGISPYNYLMITINANNHINRIVGTISLLPNHEKSLELQKITVSYDMLIILKVLNLEDTSFKKLDTTIQDTLNSGRYGTREIHQYSSRWNRDFMLLISHNKPDNSYEFIFGSLGK